MLWLTAGWVRQYALGRAREAALLDDGEKMFELKQVHAGTPERG